LSPVRWTGYQDRLARYQGVVSDKAEVQVAFEQKLAASEAKGTPTGDWSGIEAILATIVRATGQLRCE
jgi:hypothetical protein